MKEIVFKAFTQISQNNNTAVAELFPVGNKNWIKLAFTFPRKALKILKYPINLIPRALFPPVFLSQCPQHSLPGITREAAGSRDIAVGHVQPCQRGQLQEILIVQEQPQALPHEQLLVALRVPQDGVFSPSFLHPLEQFRVSEDKFTFPD